MQGPASGGVREIVRVCPRCQTPKSVREFNRRTRPSGKPSYQPYCKPCTLDYHKAWRETPEGNAKFNAAENASKARYPERVTARRLTGEAIRRGDLIPGPCELAGRECRGKIQAHHDDYSRPLDVRWVCRHHHTQLDQERRAKEAA